MRARTAAGLLHANRKPLGTRHFLFFVVGCSLVATQAAAPALMAGGPPAPQQPSLNIQKLIRDMAWNELQASRHPAHYYRYINRTISPGNSRTTEQIQTSQGVPELLLAVDGKPPSEEQRQANDNFLSRLTTDARFRQSQLKDQRQNTARRNNIIKDLPQAFIYTYLGRSKDGLIHLKFRPAPQFNPTSRQALVLEGMAGELWVDPSSQRMVEINGTLIKNVTIGWGFLARLYKGGRFLMAQSKGLDGTWHQTLLSVDFDGTELIFKGLHVHEKLIRCCFEKVPGNLSMEEAVNALREHPTPPEHWESDLEAIEKSGLPL
jgi:hypothetical protein